MLNIPITFYNTTAAAAARLLDQSSFGPTPASLQHVQTVGMDAYLNEQFATPTTTMAPIPTNPLPAVCLSANNPYVCAESEWWSKRHHRLGSASPASRLCAVGDVCRLHANRSPATPFRNSTTFSPTTHSATSTTILNDVALTPAMGDYLNMLTARIPPAGQIANENFARENMQLFIYRSELAQSGWFAAAGCK